jgi:hypothetical protein
MSAVAFSQQKGDLLMKHVPECMLICSSHGEKSAHNVLRPLLARLEHLMSGHTCTAADEDARKLVEKSKHMATELRREHGVALRLIVGLRAAAYLECIHPNALEALRRDVVDFEKKYEMNVAEVPQAVAKPLDIDINVINETANISLVLSLFSVVAAILFVVAKK